METKKGTIRLVQNVNGETNGRAWVRYEFEMTDGKKYSTFDKDLFDKYGPGMSVIMSGHQDGKFWSLDNMILDDGTTPEAEKVESPENRQITARNNSLSDPKHDSIVAQVILKGAVELTKEEMTEPNWNREAVGESLTNHVNELTGAFKLALSNVKAL